MTDHTHDRLVRVLAVGADAAIVFVEYTRSPEARHPVAVEQAYATARWVMDEGESKGLDASRLAIAGDSVGGNMAAVVALAVARPDRRAQGPAETLLIVDENDVR